MIMSTPTCVFLAIRLVAPVETVAVEVDASSVVEYGKGITYQLSRKVSAALTEQGVVVDDASNNHLRIEVRETSSFSYDVTFVLEVDGKLVDPGLEHVTCEGCRIVTMDERVLAKLPEALELMDQANEPESAVEEPPPQKPETAEDTEEPGAGEMTSQPAQEVSDPRPKKGRALGPVGFAGVAVAGAGLGGVIGGTVLLSRGDEVTVDLDDPSYVLRSEYQRGGWNWTGAGLGLMAAGLTMIVVDATVLRQHRARRVAVSPALSSAFAGAIMDMRF